MTAEEIVRQIVSGDFTSDEVRSFYDAYKFAANQLARKATFTLRRGDRVKFKDRYGAEVVGTVTDIKVKNVIVNAGTTRYTTRYRVPASLLSAA